MSDEDNADRRDRMITEALFLALKLSSYEEGDDKARKQRKDYLSQKALKRYDRRQQKWGQPVRPSTQDAGSDKR